MHKVARFYKMVEEHEKKIIFWAIRKSGSIMDAAELLGLQRNTLQMKISKLGINAECLRIKKEAKEEKNKTLK